MTVPLAVREYLADRGLEYHVIHHPVALTSQDLAEKLHVPGAVLAKTVVVRMDHELALAVLPATHRVNLHKLAEAGHAKHISLAHEEELKEAFPSCELGAMPPFGELFGMRVWCDERLAQDNAITFNGGTHADAIEMRFDEFERGTHAELCCFAERN
jgi:Ala-tRNA(Pro) deacylase